ncbi:MAG: tetratricopeptide repeat protein, partial [Pseudomonadota bacterium]
MLHRDAMELEVSTGQAGIIADWDRMVQAFLSHSAETPAHLGKVLEQDPDFALAWAAKGLFYLLLGRSELVPVARDALAEARRAEALTGPTVRERAYTEALAAYLAGRPSLAAEML